MIEITYYAKEIEDGHYGTDYPNLFAGTTVCPNCSELATVVNDCPDAKPEMWQIDCGNCDFQVYGVKVVDCSDDSNEDYYSLFPDECPCSLCSNEEPDNEWCWKQADYVGDVSETYPITMHISATATQDCTVDVPHQMIAEGKQAVFHYIIAHATAKSYTEWDYDNLDNEGYSYETHSMFVAMQLGPSEYPIPPLQRDVITSSEEGE